MFYYSPQKYDTIEYDIFLFILFISRRMWPSMEHVLSMASWMTDAPVTVFFFITICSMANVFIPPIPVEGAALFFGYLTGMGYGSPYSVIVSIVLGMAIGSTLLFLLTRRYGPEILAWRPLRKVLSEKAYTRVMRWFAVYGLWAIFLGKLVPGMSLCTVAGCGLVRMKRRRAIPAFLISNLLFYTSLVMAGNLMGDQWHTIQKILNGFGDAAMIAMAVLAVMGGGWWMWLRSNRSKDSSMKSES